MQVNNANKVFVTLIILSFISLLYLSKIILFQSQVPSTSDLFLFSYCTCPSVSLFKGIPSLVFWDTDGHEVGPVIERHWQCTNFFFTASMLGSSIILIFYIALYNYSLQITGNFISALLQVKIYDCSLNWESNHHSDSHVYTKSGSEQTYGSNLPISRWSLNICVTSEYHSVIKVTVTAPPVMHSDRILQLPVHQ